VTERLKVFGADPEDAQWDAKKRDDGSWQVELNFISGGRMHSAEWIFDPRRRHVLPADDNAARMSLPGTEPPPASPAPFKPAPFKAAATSGEATVTHLTPRLGTASPFGPVGMSNGARHERPGAGRPAAPEPAPPPQPARPAQEAQGRPETAPPPAEAQPPARAETMPAEAVPAEAARAEAVPAEAMPAEAASAEAAGAEVAAAEAAGEQAARPGRKTARGRRSSVPSWDEIMFGNSRGRD
jgi:hypothetical protein